MCKKKYSEGIVAHHLLCLVKLTSCKAAFTYLHLFFQTECTGMREYKVADVCLFDGVMSQFRPEINVSVLLSAVVGKFHMLFKCLFKDVCQPSDRRILLPSLVQSSLKHHSQQRLFIFTTY